MWGGIEMAHAGFPGGGKRLFRRLLRNDFEHIAERRPAKAEWAGRLKMSIGHCISLSIRNNELTLSVAKAWSMIPRSDRQFSEWIRL
jgi:hypothetical protein